MKIEARTHTYTSNQGNFVTFSFDAIRCAQSARRNNYTHFGIQGYGECWSGRNADKTFSRDGVQNAFTQEPAPKPWVGCVGDNFERCRGGDEPCVGQEDTNFVYAFVNGKYPSVRSKSSQQELNL